MWSMHSFYEDFFPGDNLSGGGGGGGGGGGIFLYSIFKDKEAQKLKTKNLEKP